MKLTAPTMISAILTSIAALPVSHAAQRSAEMDITVMSRGEVNPTTLQVETYVYIAFSAEGIDGVTWGLVKRIDPDGIVIDSEATPSRTRKIAFGDIDILAVSEDRLTFESWLNARLAAEKITVITRDNLNLTKLATGSYAYVVYTWRGLKRASFGKVLEVAPDGILVESGTEQTETAKIAAAEIDTLASANSPQALERWQKWNESGIVQMSRLDLNPSLLKEGLNVDVVYASHGRKRRAVGRIVDTYGDRIVIQQRLGGKNSFARRQRLEIALSDIETVVVSRDQRARTSDLLRSTMIFLHLAQ